MSTAYLNGEFIPLTEARISPLDRGFLFGDGVYEVTPVYQGIPFCLEEHFLRLEQSLKAIGIPSPLSRDEYTNIFQKLIDDNGQDQCLYLQITRGADVTRKHQFPEKIHPTVFAMTLTRHPVNMSGIKAITAKDNRWKYCYIKSINLLPNILESQEAAAKGAQETIFIRDGLVKEGSSSNIFLVKNNEIYTPPNEDGILPGITRNQIIELANKHNMPIHIQDVPESALHTADELWATSVSKEATPIISLNNQPVGLGKPGPVWQTMYNYYQEIKPK